MKIEVKNLNDYIGKIDLFISSSGFEQRSTAVGTTLDANNVKKAVIYHIEGTYQRSVENMEKVKKNLPALNIEVYQKNNPLVIFDVFYRAFDALRINSDSKSKLNVVIDITTFTREVLLILIKTISLKSFIDFFDVMLIYTPAESYSGENENFWLTKGVRDIRSVLGYSGMPSPSKNLLLVVLIGFEEERTNEIIKAYEPNLLVIGKPSQSSSVNDEVNHISLEKYNFIKEKYQSIISDEFEFSCDDVLETTAKIDSVIQQYQADYNIVIAPLNNKISTLGVALAGLQNECVQICYASANQYNIESYSKKSDYFLIYNFNELLLTKQHQCGDDMFS